MRQKPIGNYIVDFFCSKLKLVIEIDGQSHDGKLANDQIRQKKLAALGLSFLRFYDWEVKKNMTSVLQAIENWIEEFEKQGSSSQKKDSDQKFDSGEEQPPNPLF